MEDGEPIFVREETLSRGWDSSRGTVFELSDELVEQLTEVAHAWGRAPVRALPAELAAGDAASDAADDADDAGGAAADDGQWEQAVNDAPHVETRETLLGAVREGAAPVTRRPERRCRRAEPYGR